jgi:hypothetical protein
VKHIVTQSGGKDSETLAIWAEENLAGGECGGLLSLSRILNPQPELGRVTFVLAENRA